MSCKRGNVALAVNNHAMGEWTIVIYFSHCAILFDQWNDSLVHFRVNVFCSCLLLSWNFSKLFRILPLTIFQHPATFEISLWLAGLKTGDDADWIKSLVGIVCDHCAQQLSSEPRHIIFLRLQRWLFLKVEVRLKVWMVAKEANKRSASLQWWKLLYTAAF